MLKPEEKAEYREKYSCFDLEYSIVSKQLKKSWQLWTRRKITRRTIKKGKPISNFSSFTLLNCLCSAIGCYLPAENSHNSIWNLWWNIWTISIFHKMTQFSRMISKKSMRRSCTLLTNPKKSTISYFSHLMLTSPKSMIICLQNKPRKIRIEVQFVPPTKWSIFQSSQKCLRNYSSLCFISTRERPNSTWLQEIWWEEAGATTHASICGSSVAITQISIQMMMLRQETTTLWEPSW